MDMISLKATARDGKTKPGVLRRKDMVPAVVYGNKMNLSIQCAAAELHQTFARAGESTLVELDVDGKKIPVLFKEVSFHPVSDREIHVDFYAVDMTKEIETMVPVQFTGEAPALKTLGGVFVVAHDHVTVRCLPSDLPRQIAVSIAGLEAFHSAVSVKDLIVPKGVKVMDEPTTVLALVQEPRKEEEVVAATPAEGAAPVDGAAPAAGAAAPAAEGAAKDKAAAESKEKAAKK
jgi:large subunit ribosomal protein L25